MHTHQPGGAVAVSFRRPRLFSSLSLFPVLNLQCINATKLVSSKNVSGPFPVLGAERRLLGRATSAMSHRIVNDSVI